MRQNSLHSLTFMACTLLVQASVGGTHIDTLEDAFLISPPQLYSIQQDHQNIFQELSDSARSESSNGEVLDTMLLGKYSSWWHVDLSVETKLATPLEFATKKSRVLTSQSMSALGAKCVVLNGTVLSTSVYRREPSFLSYEAIGISPADYSTIITNAQQNGLTQTFATTFTDQNNQQLLSTGFIQTLDAPFVHGVACDSLAMLAAKFAENRSIWSAKSLTFATEFTSTDDPVACLMYSLYDAPSLETQQMPPQLMTLTEVELAVDQDNLWVQTIAAITVNSTTMFAGVLRPIANDNKKYYQSKFNLSLSDTEQELHDLSTTGFAPYEVTPFVTVQGEIRYNVFAEYFGEVYQKRGPNHKNGTPHHFTCFDEKVSAFLSRNGIPGGSVSIMEDGKIVHNQAYGLRQVRYLKDRNQFPPNELQSLHVTTDTRFQIGSVSKFITAQAILQFASSGHLDLDVPLFAPKHGPLTLFTKRHEEFGFEPFTTIKSEYVAKSVTTRDLLRHRSGWLSDSVFNTEIPYRTCRGILWYDLQHQPQMYTPGPAFEAQDHEPTTGYLNIHYCMLEEVLKSVARAASLTAESTTPLAQRDSPIDFETQGNPVAEMEYSEVVHKVLLEPAKITDKEISSKIKLGTARFQNDNVHESEYYCSRCLFLPVHNNATGETEVLESLYGATWNGKDIQGLGGWTATMEGLLKLVRATLPAQCTDTIRNGDDSLSNSKCLVSKQMFESMTEKPADAPVDATTWFGLGVVVQKGSVFHDGSLPGTRSELGILSRHQTADGANISYAVAFNTRNVEDIREMIETALDCTVPLEGKEKISYEFAIIIGAVLGSVVVIGILLVVWNKRLEKKKEKKDVLQQFKV